MKRIYLIISMTCVMAIALASTQPATAGDTVGKVKSVKVLPKTTLGKLGTDRMLNPQPLPPRELSLFSLSRFNRVTLNPQPLPPNPPDPKVLRTIKVLR